MRNHEPRAKALGNKYSENSDNSTDKGGSLPLANYIGPGRWSRVPLARASARYIYMR